MNILELPVRALKAWFRFARSGCAKVSIETREARLAVCMACSSLKALRCTDCGCFVQLKSYCASEDCPQEKWPKPERNDDGISTQEA